jgi:hypothetical protein
VAQIDEDAVERERTRWTRRGDLPPVSLAESSEERFESSAVELGPRRARRLFGRRAARDEFPPPLVEVLREFVYDLLLASGRDRQPCQTRPNGRFPVRHVRLP